MACFIRCPPTYVGLRGLRTYRLWRFRFESATHNPMTRSMTDKPTLRKTLLAARKLRHAQAPETAAQNLAEQAMALGLPKSQIIAAYHPMGSEIDVRPLLRVLEAQGHTLCLPFCESRELGMVFRHFAFGDALASDGVGGLAPLSDAASLRPDIILLPLVGFDRQGNRLGRGAGYYDKALNELRQTGPIVTYGMAYDMQMVDKCPSEPHDQAIDGVVTETNLYLV